MESAYEVCLCHKSGLRALDVERQKALPIVFKEVKLDCGYRLDLLVSNPVVVEIKAVEVRLPVHEAQLLTDLKVGGWNEGSRRFTRRHGIKGRHTPVNSVTLSSLRVLRASVLNAYQFSEALAFQLSVTLKSFVLSGA